LWLLLDLHHRERYFCNCGYEQDVNEPRGVFGIYPGIFGFSGFLDSPVLQPTQFNEIVTRSEILESFREKSS